MSLMALPKVPDLGPALTRQCPAAGEERTLMSTGKEGAGVAVHLPKAHQRSCRGSTPAESSPAIDRLPRALTQRLTHIGQRRIFHDLLHAARRCFQGVIGVACYTAKE